MNLNNYIITVSKVKYNDMTWCFQYLEFLVVLICFPKPPYVNLGLTFRNLAPHFDLYTAITNAMVIIIIDYFITFKLENYYIKHKLIHEIIKRTSIKNCLSPILLCRIQYIFVDCENWFLVLNIVDYVLCESSFENNPLSTA